MTVYLIFIIAVSSLPPGILEFVSSYRFIENEYVYSTMVERIKKIYLHARCLQAGRYRFSNKAGTSSPIKEKRK